MKYIELTQGQRAKVDDDLYEWLNRYKWQAQWKPQSHAYYAVGTVGGKTVKMHVLIAQPPNGFIADHRDHDTLNNQRYNLRTCTQQKNIWNSQKRRNCSSRHRGVDWNKEMGRWRARINVDGKEYYLGYFRDEDEAGRVYNAEAARAFGEFAVLNDC